MSEENIYATPESNPETPENSDPSNVLATRLSRLGAAILDGLIMTVIIAPLMIFTGYYSDISQGIQPSYLEQLGYSLVGIVAFMLINFSFLLNQGQTIGKKIVGIKIVGLNVEKLNVAIIGKRYGFYFLVGQIPMVGGIISLVNILFIFGKEQRCLHDLVAETKVVKCQKP
jgi:uncharacterized RDD family membrane protein YckC